MLEPLYPLLRHHDPNIQTAALSLLHNLSILEENEAKVINMGYVPEVRTKPPFVCSFVCSFVYPFVHVQCIFGAARLVACGNTI